MSTHANIITKLSTDRYAVVYLHNDGYPSHALKTLRTYYNTQEKAEALAALGNLSTLRESSEAPIGHNFDNPSSGCSVAYNRDRGEKGQQAKIFGTLNDALEETDEVHVYVWDGKTWDVGGVQ